jgi:predicted PurR-regulated permease PerM
MLRTVALFFIYSFLFWEIWQIARSFGLDAAEASILVVTAVTTLAAIGAHLAGWLKQRWVIAIAGTLVAALIGFFSWASIPKRLTQTERASLEVKAEQRAQQEAAVALEQAAQAAGKIQAQAAQAAEKILEEVQEQTKKVLERAQREAKAVKDAQAAGKIQERAQQEVEKIKERALQDMGKIDEQAQQELEKIDEQAQQQTGKVLGLAQREAAKDRTNG